MKFKIQPLTSMVFAVVSAISVAQAQAAPFKLEEATVDSIHAAFNNKTLTCTALVQSYLDRIAAYDQQGPSLHAILTVNNKALDTARAMDAQYAKDSRQAGALFCIPIILKDNYNTFDMPTSGGNVAMKNSQPSTDAFTVARMRQAGAIILAKANMQEFARGGVSISSLGGQVLNPYDLTRNPGGSSGGTGASIAANFAVLGTGSDTGQSIRSPASANSLVGVRPTRGLVSRDGVMPNSFTQDEVGPITRTVKDAALLLDVMVGFDDNDPITAFGVGKAPKTYTAALKKDALKGARIGVMNNLYGKAEANAPVNAAMDAVIRNMQAQGAVIVRFDLPEYDVLSKVVATDTPEASPSFAAYFKALGDNAPITSFRQLVDTKTASPDIQKTLEKEVAIDNGMQTADYKDRLLNRDKMRLAVAKKMAELHISAILYPLQRVLVSHTGGSDQPERNGLLSNSTGFPAVTFQAGFSEATASAPLGVPVGAELLALDYSEPTLLSYAYAYEQAYHLRRAPVSTPPLKK